MCAKDTAQFDDSVVDDPVWISPRGYPTYGRLYAEARSVRKAGLEAAGKSRDQVAKSLDVFDWAFNRFTEAAGVFIEDHLDDRILNRAVSDRVLQRTLRRLSKKSHDEVRSILRRHVRPVALEITRKACNFTTLSEALTMHIKLRRISLSALASQVGMHQGTIYGWIERGALPTTASNLQRLAAIEKVLQVAPGTLMLLAQGPRRTDLASLQGRDFLGLADALQHFIQLRGRTLKDVALDAGMSFGTLYTWLRKDCSPRRADTIAALERVEEVLDLEPGTLLRFIDGEFRYLETGHEGFGVTEPVWSVIRRHFPDDFDSRPRSEQREIVDWAIKTIWTIPRDENDTGGDRSTYRCQFKGVRFHAGVQDGVFFAPDGLQREYDALIDFKTAYPAPVGKRRGARWRDGTISAQTAAFGIFFGALARVEPDLPVGMMSFLNIGDPRTVRRVISFVVDRRGHPTPTIIGLIHALVALFNPDDGFIIQHRELFIDRYPGLPDGENLEHFCRETIAMLYRELDAWQDKITAGRSSFRAIAPVLRSDRPLDVYHQIVEHIDQRTPPRATQELEWARCLRRSMVIHLLEILPLRRKDITSLRLHTNDEQPPSFDALARSGHGLIYFDGGTWRFRQPKSVFKNHGSPATSDVDVALVNWRDLYDRLDLYLAARAILLRGGKDHGQFIVKDNSQASSQADKPLGVAEFSNLFTETIRLYGVHNPYTGNGAIVGLGIHRPHSVRHVVATHLAKAVDYDAAAARLFDTVKRIMETYADYSATEKFEDSDTGYDESFDDPAAPRRRRKRSDGVVG